MRPIVEDVKWHVPQRGDKKRLIELSERNAKYTMLDRRKQQEQVDPEAAQNRIMETLQKDLHPQGAPRAHRVFRQLQHPRHPPRFGLRGLQKGQTSKADYRKFNIKTVEAGPDDFASMAEVVHRRYKRLVDEGEPLQQLIIVDGGKGQLSSAVGALAQLDLIGKVAIIGIAKRLEELYFPETAFPSTSTSGPNRSSSSSACGTRRTASRCPTTASAAAPPPRYSALDDIPGVGPATRRKLMAEFGTVDAIKTAHEDDLLKVVNLQVAQAIRTWQTRRKDKARASAWIQRRVVRPSGK